MLLIPQHTHIHNFHVPVVPCQLASASTCKRRHTNRFLPRVLTCRSVKHVSCNAWHSFCKTSHRSLCSTPSILVCNFSRVCSSMREEIVISKVFPSAVWAGTAYMYIIHSYARVKLFWQWQIGCAAEFVSRT